MKISKFERLLQPLLILAVFAIGFLACCLITYSDGDDAFFLKTVSEHPSFWDFTSHLTRTMNGRITATASLWVIFSNSIRLWRFLNAAVITLLTLVISNISKTILKKENMETGVLLFSAASFAIMGVGIMGYSCLWITGSVNYLWPCVAGLAALTPFIKSVFDENYTAKNFSYIISAILGMYACLAQEQIGAVIICSSLIIIVYNKIKTKKFNIYQIIPFVLMLAAFVLLVASPANANRGEKEILRWLPEYAGFTFWDKLFITVQWLLHFTANSLRYIFIFLWGCLGINFLKEKRKIAFIICIILIVVAILPLLGADCLTNLGLNELDMTKKVENAPEFEDLNIHQISAGVWWIFCIVITAVLVFLSAKVKTLKFTRLLIYLAAFASAAIMIFSPTIYASGERTLFVTAVLLTVLTSTFIDFKSQKISHKLLYIASLIATAGMQLFGNIDYLMKMI